MQKTIIAICALSLVWSIAISQEHYVWLKLSDGKVVINAEFLGMSIDTLEVAQGMRRLEIPLAYVDKFRIIRESSIVEGALYGASIGFGAGAVLGFLVRSGKEEGQSPLGTVAVLTVVGGVVGTMKSGFEKPEPIVDLRGKTSEEKRKVIEQLMLDDK